MKGEVMVDHLLFERLEFPFEKFEGAGNDFITIVRGPSFPTLYPSHVPLLCDRRRGIGADGVLILQKTSADLWAMEVWNADGSIAEMCGNGLRCASALLAARGEISARAQIQTGAGLIPVEVFPTGEVSIDLPHPEWGSPLHFEGYAPLDTLSFGNPHGISFDSRAIQERENIAPSWGTEVPGGINISFVEQVGEQRLKVWVFERGAGWTQACGTGAAASVCAAVKRGILHRDRSAYVQLPGGELKISLNAERVQLTGPARHCFSGYWRGVLA